MKTIKILTNLVQGGIDPLALETGVGGSEEKLIEFGREMAKKYDVTIYTNGRHGDFDGVKYRAHREFKPFEKHDVFISFKTSHMLANSINAEKIFHWTTEVEPTWKQFMLDSVDKVICISDFHRKKMSPKNEKFDYKYLWADLERLDRNIIDKVEYKTPIGDSLVYLNGREEGSMLYSSSYDRGLEDLLVNWPNVRERLELKTLYITYGWDFLVNVIKHNPNMISWKQKMDKLMEQDGIVHLGRLSNDEVSKMYWRCEYWALPLNNPDSELFCINAIKAQYCGAKPVVRLAGALQETVNNFIPYEFIIEGREFKNLNKKQINANKKHAMKFNLLDKIKEWEQMIELEVS